MNHVYMMHEQKPMISFDQKAKKHQNPKFLKMWKSLNKCMKTCNMIKKKGKKCLTLGLGRKPLKLWPRKWPKKKKNFVRRDRERNQRERQRTFEKIRYNSYMLLKIEIQLFERNRLGIEMYMKKGLIGRKESKGPETLSWKTDFLLHILIGWKIDLISRILKK